MPGLGPSNAIASLDGPYRPNRALDIGRRLAECPGPDNLVWQDDHLLFSSGKAVLLVDELHDHGREAEEILRFESMVTAMAAAKDGSLAIGLGPEGIAIVGGEHDGKVVATIPGVNGDTPTALCFGRSAYAVCLHGGGSGGLPVAHRSSRRRAALPGPGSGRSHRLAAVRPRHADRVRGRALSLAGMRNGPSAPAARAGRRASGCSRPDWHAAPRTGFGWPFPS